MSGFEVCGVVLGVIPLVISALEHYKAGKGGVSSFMKWRGHLDTLIFRLKMQRTFFYLNILELLREAGVEEVEEGGDLTEADCLEVLRNAKRGDEIRDYLGLLYDPFLEVLGRYEGCLKTIAAKLGHIRRPPNTKKDDLIAILGANPPKSESFSFKGRLTFTIERASLAELVEELREDRLSLKTLIKSLKTQQEYLAREPSSDARRLAATFTEIRQTASSLFLAMCESCTCRCQRKHKIMIRLENRMPTQRKRPKLVQKAKEPTTFDLVLGLDGFFQEASLSALPGGGDGPCHKQTIDMSPSPVGAKNVMLAVPTITISPLITLNQQLPQGNSSKVTNICRHASEANVKGHILALELKDDVISLIQPQQQPPCRRYAKPTTLEQILMEGCRDEDAQMTPKQQTHLALDVASAILQLRQTHWSSQPWSSAEIKFLLPHRQLQEEVHRAELCGPFVEQVIGRSLTAKGKAASNGPTPGPNPKTALLELAIMLLEIWHHKPLAVWAAKLGVKGAGSEGEGREEARRIAAIRWLELTSERLPPHHLTAVEQCLAICSGRLWVWDDGDFQRRYCENIIKPLRESCAAWL